MDTLGTDVRIPIRIESDILAARQRGRTLAEEVGFTGSDLAIIATAISELARNIIQHAGSGEMIIAPIDGSRRGILVVARDEGPGIADIDRAMQDGFSTLGSLGLGLPGAKRLMDEFELESEVGRGTTITARKWSR
jgi:serine/threonine-protein kinase RsbT